MHINDRRDTKPDTSITKLWLHSITSENRHQFIQVYLNHAVVTTAWFASLGTCIISVTCAWGVHYIDLQLKCKRYVQNGPLDSADKSQNKDPLK